MLYHHRIDYSRLWGSEESILSSIGGIPTRNCVWPFGAVLGLSAGQAAGSDPRADPPIRLVGFSAFSLRFRLGFFRSGNPIGCLIVVFGKV